MLERGIPEHVRCDNGPEMVAKALRQWLVKLGTRTLYIEPGSPWENGYCESFNGKLRDECLKLEMDAATPKDASKLKPEEKKKADEQQKILVQKNNAAVDELQAVVGRFNEQLKIFKAKSAAGKS